MLQSCNTTIDQLSTPDGGRTKRYKCPVHGGKKKSVAVWWNNGPRAYCHSRQCAQADILAALGITNAKSTSGLATYPSRFDKLPEPLHSRSVEVASVKPLPPVTPVQALDYLSGINTPAGAGITYQRDDGLKKSAYRAGKERWTTKGMTGDGWQLRRFDPVDPASAEAIVLSEGEKDAAILATAGLIAFTAPRGAQSLPLADFGELVELAKDTGLPVLLCGDNDLVGREAMRKVRALLKKDHHLDATYLFGEEEKGSIADLPTQDLKALIRLELLDLDESWQKPGRNRRQYQQYKCLQPKRYLKSAGDGGEIWALVSCGNTATCTRCRDWENFLHVERCWRGDPAQMIQIFGFGDDASTIAQTTGLAKVCRSHFEGRLRKNSYVHQNQEKNHSRERRNFVTALTIGHDYRASLTMFLSRPLSDKEVAKERHRAERAGLSFTVKEQVTREDIEDASPPSLTINMEGVGTTGKTNTWTSSGWPTWWQAETTYAFGDPRELTDSEAFPDDSISAKDWRREYHQEWDSKKSLTDNLVQREEFAAFNAAMWVSACVGLNVEILYGIAKASTTVEVTALVAEIGDYRGPAALLRDTADWIAGRRDWRPAFRVVLDVAGW